MSVQAVDILEFVVSNAVSNYGAYTHQRSRSKGYLVPHKGREVLLYYRGYVLARLRMQDGDLSYEEASDWHSWMYKRRPWRAGLSPSYKDPVKYDLADPDTPDKIDKKLKRLLLKSNFFSCRVRMSFLTVLSVLAIVAVIVLLSMHSVGILQ